MIADIIISHNNFTQSSQVSIEIKQLGFTKRPCHSYNKWKFILIALFTLQRTHLKVFNGSTKMIYK